MQIYVHLHTFTFVERHPRTHKHAYMHTCIHRYVHCIALYCIAWHTNVNSAMQCPAIQRNRYIHSSVRISDVTIASPSIRICQGNFLRWPYLRLLNHYKSARYCNIHYEYLCYIIFFRNGPLWAVNFKVLTGFDVIWIAAPESPIGCLAGWEQIWKNGWLTPKLLLNWENAIGKMMGIILLAYQAVSSGSEVVSHWIVSDRDMGGTPFSNPQLWPINMWLHKVYIPQISIHGHISVLLPRNSIYKYI